MSQTEYERSASHWDKMYSTVRVATWHTNPIVNHEICCRIAGIPKHWLYWLFQDKLASRPNTLLSIGCGDGSHELIIARNGFAGHVDAFDASPVGIANAQGIAESEGLNARFYVETFDGFIAKPIEKTYDVVLFVGSLHHVRDLEGMLDKVRRSINPGGIIIYNEYIGPCYIILPEAQVQIVNAAVAALASEFKVHPDIRWNNPAIDLVLSGDPSESVRSALIPQFLRFYFDIEWEAQFGGALLHPLFQMLNADKLADGSPESQTVVRLLIAMENMLMQAGVLGSDCCIGFGSPRQSPAKAGPESEPA
jgi:SAM-dependent methyltransferase